MRTPTLVVVAIVALGSNLANASPLPSPGSYNSHVYAVSAPGSQSQDSSPARIHPIIGTKMARSPDHSPSLFTLSKIGPRELLKKALDAFTAGGNAYSGAADDASGGSVGNVSSYLAKRVDDVDTLGGNAYTGNSGDVNGGDVVNQGDNFGMPTIMNMNSNNAGGGGEAIAGCANGGHGNNNKAGGNAHSGNTGNAVGGSVRNAGSVMNVDSNNAGGAGHTQTGCATGGDVNSLTPPTA